MVLTDPKSMIRVAREAGGEAHVEPLNLGERVRELRRSRGWTLEEAAVRAGLARSRGCARRGSWAGWLAGGEAAGDGLPIKNSRHARA